MKNLQLKAATALCASALLAGCAATPESTFETQPYVTNGKDTVVRVKDREGRCIRTKDWTEETATRECDPQLFPDPAPAAEPVYESMTLAANALFAFDSAEVTEQGLTALREVGEKIRANSASVVDIDIIGHTDSIGPEDYNQQLSLRRATAMKDFLVSEQNIDAAIIDVSGMGESQPIADNATADGRALNRRVEVRIGVKVAN